MVSEEEEGKKNSEEACLSELRGVLEEKVEVSSLPLDETRFLLRFARVKKYDVKKATKTLRNYLEWRRRSETTHGYAFLPSAVSSVLSSGMINVLKERDPWGRVVYVFRTDLWDPLEVSLDAIIVASILVLEEMLESEETQKSGVVLVSDMRGLRFRQFFQGTPNRILRILAVLQGNFPVKCKGLHSVNEPKWLMRMGMFAKAFFSEKLQKRVHFHGKDYEGLHEFIPPSILPPSLGGGDEGAAEWGDVVDGNFIPTLLGREEFHQKWGRLKYKL